MGVVESTKQVVQKNGEIYQNSGGPQGPHQIEMEKEADDVRLKEWEARRQEGEDQP